MLYTATVRDQTILSESTLQAVLDLVADFRDPAVDVVVWQGSRVVAVVHGDGRITTVAAAPLAA